MQTKVVTYQDSEVTAELTVARSNYRMGLIHSSLIDSARERLFPKKKAQTEPDAPRRYQEDYWLELFSYPALCAGTLKGVFTVTQANGEKEEIKLDLHKHVTWEQYEDLPGEFVTQWENAIFELNPHWLPAKPAEEQKKSSWRIYRKLARRGKHVDPRGDSEESLVPVELHDPEFAFYVYDLVEAFDWRFLPSQLLAEDESLMDDLFTIRQMSDWVKETGEVEQMSSWSRQKENSVTRETALPRPDLVGWSP